jgi:nitronate monooxygenase
LFTLDSLKHPIIQAPMAGGPSTPALAAAVSGAGGLGFVAAGYKTAAAVREDIERTRELTGPELRLGVNLFLVAEGEIDDAHVSAYAAELAGDERTHEVPLGEARFDDDDLAAKLKLVAGLPVPVVSFTFGCPSVEQVRRLHERGIAVWVTVTDVAEAEQAAGVSADALIAQGIEAGGHRGSFADTDGHGELSLLPLLRLLATVTELPLIASGGIADGAGIAAALVAGARAVQIGTGFMRAHEAATASAHREALAQPRPTAVTRAFTGRRARGIVNAFMREHGAAAPSAYPHVHHLTAPLRAAARQTGDAEGVNLWAGEAHLLAQEQPAAELMRRWNEEARTAVDRARGRLGD